MARSSKSQFWSLLAVNRWFRSARAFTGELARISRIRPFIEMLEDRCTPALVPVTVHISELTQLRNPDGFLSGDGEYYAKVQIGSSLQNTINAIQDVNGDNQTVSPNWAVTAYVDDSAPVAIRIELWDDDDLLTFFDDRVDVNPTAGQTDISLMFDPKSNSIVSDTSQGAGDESGDARLAYRVFRSVPVSFTVAELFARSDPDGLGAGDGDFYATVQIGQNREQNSADDNITIAQNSSAKPPWLFTSYVPATGGPVDVRFRILDSDGLFGGADDLMDINPNAGQTEVTVSFDPTSAAVLSGSSSGNGEADGNMEVFYNITNKQIVWINRGRDDFGTFSDPTVADTPNAARRIVDAAMEAWDSAIETFNHFANNNVVGLQVNANDAGGNRGQATVIDSEGDKPLIATIDLSNTIAHFFDTTPKAHSEFALLDSQYSARRIGATNDLYTTVLHEIGHAVGINSSMPGLTDTGFTGLKRFTAGGLFVTFTNDGHIYAGPADVTGDGIADVSEHPFELLNSGATVPNNVRRLISPLDLQLLGAAYGYTTVPAAKLPNFIAQVDPTSRELTVRGINQANNDNTSIRRQGDEVIVVVNGFTSNIPVSAIQNIRFDGGGGADLLTIDFDGGSPVPAGGLTYNGGADPGFVDTLILQGGTFATVTYSGTTTTNGTVTHDGSTITYTGLDPIIDNTSATDRVFIDDTGFGQQIRLMDDGDPNNNMSIIDSNGTGGFESITFVNPTNSLTVKGGVGADTIQVNKLDSGFAAQINLDGEGNGDSYVVNIAGGAASSLINVSDTGADAEVDALLVNGTDSSDDFLLRASKHDSPTGIAFVAALHGDPVSSVERVNYNKSIESLEVDGGGGGDKVTLDDNWVPTKIRGGAGDDRFQVGQIFKSERDAVHANIPAQDEFETTLTTRGHMSNGVNFETTVEGGGDNDIFVVFRNKALVHLLGGNGEDSFTVRAFALEGSFTSSVSGQAGSDTVQYVLNAPINILGGDGSDTVRIIATEFADKIVITSAGVFGIGIIVSYADIEKLIIDAAEGDDEFYVLSTNPSVETVLEGGLGSDRFFIGGDVPEIISGAVVLFPATVGPHTLVGIADVLLTIDGEAGPGSAGGLGKPVMLPGETNVLPSVGDVLTYAGSGAAGATDAMTIDGTNLLAAGFVDPANELVGKSIEVSSGPGLGRFWLITAVAAGAAPNTWVLTIKNPSKPDPDWGIPDGTSKYAVTSFSLNFFVNEDDQIDQLTVFNDAETRDQTGTLTSTMLTGLGMDAGIAYAALEKLDILLGMGRDSFTVAGTPDDSEVFVNTRGAADMVTIMTTGARSNLQVHTEGNSDQVNLRGTGSGSITNIQTGQGNDIIRLSSNAGINDDGNLDGIGGSVFVDAGAGRFNRLIVSDLGGDANNAVVLTSSTITGLLGAAEDQLLMYAASGGHFTNGAANDGIVVRGSMRPDVFHVLSTLKGSTTHVAGQGAADRFNVGSTAAANNGRLDLIAGLLTLDGGSGYNIAYVNDAGTAAKLAADYILRPSRLMSHPRTPRAFAGLRYFGMKELRLDGTAAPNVFFVTPSRVTEFYLDGNHPPPRRSPSPPADILRLEASDARAHALAIERFGKGYWTFKGPHKKVYFEDMELLHIDPIVGQTGTPGLPLLPTPPAGGVTIPAVR